MKILFTLLTDFLFSHIIGTSIQNKANTMIEIFQSISAMTAESQRMVQADAY